jgi:hypothetical protein
MPSQAVKICLFAAMVAIFAAPATAHPNLNGTWTLVPTQSDFGGQPVLQTGTVTFNEREHHMYISRTFNYDGAAQSFNYSFSTDGAENSTIKNGKTFKSKATWEGDVLKVKTTDNGVTTIERFRLGPDNTLTVVVDRSDHKPVTLVFERR